MSFIHRIIINENSSLIVSRYLYEFDKHLYFHVHCFFFCVFFIIFIHSGRYRLQDFDNGYFEKFGSLLQRKIQDVDQNIASKQATDSESLGIIEEAENDSGTETLHDTDSEPDDQQSKQEDLIEECTGLNVSIYLTVYICTCHFTMFLFCYFIFALDFASLSLVFK